MNGTVSTLMIELGEQAAPTAVNDVIQCGALIIDVRARKVIRSNTEITLTPKEFDILYFLARNRGEVFTKEQIYRAVWNEVPVGRCHAVENTVFQIRKKIKSVLHSQDYIKTIAGYGYKFNSW